MKNGLQGSQSKASKGAINAYGRRKELTELGVFPQLREWGISLRGRTIVDLGCGYGGGTFALEEKGATALGVDLNGICIEQAAKRAIELDSNCEFFCHDATLPAAAHLENRADGLLMQELIEHLPDPEAALAAALSWIKPEGWCYVSFPPYYSPAGGHHHYARKPYCYIPWLHLIFSRRWLERVLPDIPRYREEVSSLNRMSIHRFENAAIQAGWTIEKKASCLIRPSIAGKFGLPVIRANSLGKVVGLREFLITGVEYLLRKTTPKRGTDRRERGRASL